MCNKFKLIVGLAVVSSFFQVAKASEPVLMLPSNYRLEDVNRALNLEAKIESSGRTPRLTLAGWTQSSNPLSNEGTVYTQSSSEPRLSRRFAVGKATTGEAITFHQTIRNSNPSPDQSVTKDQFQDLSITMDQAGLVAVTDCQSSRRSEGTKGAKVLGTQPPPGFEVYRCVMASVSICEQIEDISYSKGRSDRSKFLSKTFREALARAPMNEDQQKLVFNSASQSEWTKLAKAVAFPLNNSGLNGEIQTIFKNHTKNLRARFNEFNNPVSPNWYYLDGAEPTSTTNRDQMKGWQDKTERKDQEDLKRLFDLCRKHGEEFKLAKQNREAKGSLQPSGSPPSSPGDSRSSAN